MLLSIVIPHRNRNRQIYQLIWSIDRSARASGISDSQWEVIIVDSRSRQRPTVPIPCRFILCDRPPGVLNKPLLMNQGIEAAHGDVLAFVDADMLVGKFWMRGTLDSLTGDNPPHRLCYRVRQLKLSDQAHQNTDVVLAWLDGLDDDPEAKGHLLDAWFSEYERYTKGFEAYGEPEAGNFPRVPGPVFGNSQFAVRRDVLGDLRFNEEQVGAGWEDIWFAWAQWNRWRDEYRGAIFTDADYALLHIWHGSRKEEPGSDWYPPDANGRNEEIFYEDKWREQV